MKARSRLVSAYTPSNTDPEVLKRIFVQREGILKRLVNRLSLALEGRKSYHALLIGPRGSGKTHLVTMTVHELERREELRNRIRIAWLGEDDTCTGLIDIALGMGDQLAMRYPDQFPADFRKEVRGLKAEDAAEAILTRILERASEAHVLLVMENLNRAFHGLGDSGQKQWRAFLQNRGRITLLGTSQQLFEGIESRDRPFFGFFDITHLHPLSVEDAGALIEKIAREEGRDELAQFLATPEGRFRIRALHHLAGGNHRLYVQLSEFLTKDSLEDLVTAFEQIEEELTPYFQERLRSLAPQQARIVECLCGAPGAMSVKQIHEDTFIPEGSCSKQLSLLKQMNYVRGTSSGKETFYELCEPLLRLCLEVKHRRGAPLALVVQFIRAWFPQDKLKSLHDRQNGHSPLTGYLDRALVEDEAVNRWLFESLSREVDQRLSAGELARASQLREELAFMMSNESGLVVSGADKRGGGRLESPRRTSARAKIDEQIDEGVEHAKAGRPDAAIAGFSAIIELADALPDQVASARFNRGVVYGQRGDVDGAIADYTAVIEQLDAPSELVAMARFNRGFRYGQRGNAASAITDYTAVIEQVGAPWHRIAMARFNRGNTYGQQGDLARAIADYTAVIEQVDAPPSQVAKARFNRGNAYGQQGDLVRAIADYTAVIEQVDAPPDLVVNARVNRGIGHGRQGNLINAIADHSAVIEKGDALPDQVASARFNRGVAFGQRGDVDGAIADYTAVIEQVDAPPEWIAWTRFNRGVAFGQQGNVDNEIADYTAVIEQVDAPPVQVARARINRGNGYAQQGDVDSAIADYTAVIEQVNAPLDQVAWARFSRGLSYGQQGDVASEIADYTAVIEQLDAPPELVARARFSRGLSYGQQGDVPSEIADYTAVIEQVNAPPDQVAKARFNRGLSYSQQGDVASEIADYTAVIEQVDAPPDQVSKARFNRGVSSWRAGNYSESEADFRAVLDDPSSPEDSQHSARFAVIEPMIITSDAPTVASALAEAFQRVPRESPSYGGTPGDVAATLLRRGHQDWATYLQALVPVYLANNYASELGTAAVRSAGVFDGGDYSVAQMDTWLAAWRSAADENEQLHTSTEWLAAALEAIKNKSERPYLSIPLEIRTLVRPLLSNSLGPIETKS